MSYGDPARESSATLSLCERAIRTGDKLPQMKARDVIRALRQDGWEPARQRGSHQHFVHPTKPGTVTVPVPPGRDVKSGTLRSILTQAGLTVDEFRDLL